MSDYKETRIFGPPGTGKTTSLSGLIATACRDVGSEAVLVSSFTKAAARELVGRQLPLNDDQVGTLHALCFRALDRPKLITSALLKDWNAEHPTKAFGGIGTDLDDPYGSIESDGADQGDELLQELNRLRGLQVDETMWPIRVQSFAEDWKAFKSNTWTMDFTDLIERCVEEQLPIPHAARVLFLDEVQDFSPLELRLARWWGGQCEQLYLAGDDDQCHPPDTMIRTMNRGDVPIADLQSTDRLRSYDRIGGSEFRGGAYRAGKYRGKRLAPGYRFQRTERHYSGNLHIFETVGGSLLKTTHDHRMMVQWTDLAKGAVGVYVMRRGLTWRVGTSEIIRRQSGIFGPIQRARQEGADEIWLLDIFPTPERAKLEEDYIAAQYGFSRLVFSAKYQKTLAHDQSSLDWHHARMGFIARLDQLFNDYQKDRAFPFWNRKEGQVGRGCGSLQIVRAVNCFPRYMQFLRDVGHPKGEKDRIQRILRIGYMGPVYSLNVEPYHMYVAESIATPNCLYRFKGATPAAFLSPALPAEQVRILGQSYRVPRAVHAAAVRWVEQIETRMPKAYQPRDFEGSVEQIPMNYQYPAWIHDRLNAWIDQGKTVAFLASCSYFLEPLKKQLREWGVPFHNPYRLKRGDWNPLGHKSFRGTEAKATCLASDRILAYKRPSLPPEHRLAGWWTYRDLWDWAGILEAEGLFRHGAKTEMRRKAEHQETGGLAVEADDLEKWICDPTAAEMATAGDLGWYRGKFLKSHERPMQYACNVLEHRGIEGLEKKPQVILGTIHSVKGGEADIVVLFPDLSAAGFREWSTPGEARDSVRRCFYVGMTRAKEELYWAQPVGMSIAGYL